MRLAREAGVERFQLPGGAEQQPGRLVPATLLQRDLAAQVLCLGGTQHVRRPGVGRGQQVERRVQGARVARGPRRVEQPLRAPERDRGSASLPGADTRRPRPGRREPAPGPRSGSSSAATSSSGPGAACAWCQAWRSGSAAESVAAASARWTSCHSVSDAER